MNVLRYSHVLLCGLMVLLLSGCAAEDGDLSPPDATYDGGVQTPTTSTSAVLTGTVETGALITAESNTTGDLVVTQDDLLGTWSCTVDNMIEGTNVILVSATDPVGNTRLMQINIVVDLTGPTTTIDQYPEIAQPGQFNFAGTVDEAGSTVSVEVLNSGGGSTGISGVASVDADIWDIDLDLSGLGNGDYSVVATGTDRLLNVSATPAEQVVSINSANAAFSIVPVSPAVALPVILNTDESSQLFNGTAPANSLLTVTPSTTVTQPDAIGVWDATVSGITAANTVVSFDVDGGNAVRKVLVVRDQSAPTVVEWSSVDAISITVDFNESMAAATIDPENLIITHSDGTDMLVSAVTGSDRIFTFTTEDLTVLGGAFIATLQATTTFTVEDGRGNGLAASYVWRFNK